MKKGCAILFLILTFCCYGQNSTLLQNIDFRAEELEHSLSKTGDTLILNSERTIDKVDIFNGNLEKTFIINDTSTKISLDEFPNGRYVTQVKVHDKLIIITLLRHSASDKSLAKIEKKDLEEDFSDSNLEIKNSSEGKQLKANLSTKVPIKIVKFYWIVKNINKGHSSSKQMRIGNKPGPSKRPLNFEHMNVRTQSVNFNAEPKLLAFVEDKLQKLDQFYDQIVDTEVYLRVENVTDGVNKLAEVRVNIPGNDLIAKKQCKSFEEAIDQSVDVLKRQLNKRKERVRGV